ncbi:hypothetical protein ABS735_04775 [Streptomyces sp. MMCC 100]|uniref:hypothetical protein n=1 Tax=Streptomyces sp. MMCC 100 TaxID=3163555 RepID=UPI00359BC19C
MARDLKPVYTAVNEEHYSSIAGTWQRAWNEFVPFLGLPDEVRQVVFCHRAARQASYAVWMRVW